MRIFRWFNKYFLPDFEGDRNLGNGARMGLLLGLIITTIVTLLS